MFFYGFLHILFINTEGKHLQNNLLLFSNQKEFEIQTENQNAPYYPQACDSSLIVATPESSQGPPPANLCTAHEWDGKHCHHTPLTLISIN